MIRTFASFHSPSPRLPGQCPTLRLSHTATKCCSQQCTTAFLEYLSSSPRPSPIQVFHILKSLPCPLISSLLVQGKSRIPLCSKGTGEPGTVSLRTLYHGECVSRLPDRLGHVMLTGVTLRFGCLVASWLVC